MALLIFGELNVFRREDALEILRRARAALAPGGRIVLEVHPFAAVRACGQRPPSWYAAPRGLFADGPYVCLTESFWNEGRSAAIERHWVIHVPGGEVERLSATMQAYDAAAFDALLAEAGFGSIRRAPAMSAPSASSKAGAADLAVLIAEAGATLR